MPDVKDGIETAPEHDVNTAAGFEAAMAGRGVTRLEGEEPSTETSVASGLTFGRAEPSAPEEPAAPVPTPPANEPTPEESQQFSPEVQAFLAKYDGDPVKALAAAAEAQSVIGRQGNELGELRNTVARLEGMVSMIQQAPAQQQYLTQEQIDEQAATYIGSLGFAEAATRAANDSLETGDERAYAAIIEAWQTEEPFNAMNHIADFRAWQREQQAEAKAQEAAAARTGITPEEYVRQAQAVEAMNQTVGVLFNERRDSWDTFAPHMEEALAQFPLNIQEMFSSPDPDERLIAARIVADRATMIAGTKAPAATEAVPTPAAQAKQRAVVATGSLRPAAVPAATGGQQTREEAIAQFKKDLLASETTSVRDGLTFGPEPGARG